MLLAVHKECRGTVPGFFEYPWILMLLCNRTHTYMWRSFRCGYRPSRIYVYRHHHRTEIIVVILVVVRVSLFVSFPLRYFCFGVDATAVVGVFVCYQRLFVPKVLGAHPPGRVWTKRPLAP